MSKKVKLVKDLDYNVVSLITIITHYLETKKWTKNQVCKAIGVTPYQVYCYATGKTITPSPTICLNIFNNLKFEGLNCLVDIYSNHCDLIEHNEAVSNG